MNPTWAYVALLFFLAVAAARRAGVTLPWRVALLFYLLTLAFLWRPMTEQVVNFPADAIRLLPPWQNPRGHFDKYDVSNFELADLTMQIVPWMEQTRRAWRAGELPLWNAASSCGYPLLGNAQSAALSPLRIATLPLPLGYAVTAEGAMKILIALTFAFLWLRRRYGELPSVIGAVSFAFGSFVVIWLHFPMATAAVFLPAVLLLIDSLAEQPRRANIVFAAVIWACILFAGHPETAAHIFFFAVVYWIWRATLRQTWAPMASLLLAAVIASPFLFAFLQTLPRARRFAEMSKSGLPGIPFSDWASLILLVQPQFFGRMPGEIPWGPSLAEALCGFAGILGVAAWVALVVRLIEKRDWRSFETFLIIASALTFGVLSDFDPVSDPFRALFQLANNSRLRLMLTLLSAAMTCAALEHALRERIRPLRIGTFCAAWLLLGLIVGVDFPSAWAHDTAVLSLLPSVAVLAAVCLPRKAAIVLLVAVIAELWIPLRGWNPVVPTRELYPKTPLIARLQSLVGNDVVRVAGLGGSLFPNTHALFGFEDIRQHDPMANRRVIEYYQSVTRYDLGEYYPKWNDPDSPALDLLNVKYLTTAPGATLNADRWILRYDGRDGRIFENRTVRPRFYGDAAIHIARTSATDFTLTIDAARPTLIESSQPLWPGWRVERNGTRVEPVEVNHAFLGFRVPAGRSTVRVWY